MSTIIYDYLLLVLLLLLLLLLVLPVLAVLHVLQVLLLLLFLLSVYVNYIFSCTHSNSHETPTSAGLTSFGNLRSNSEVLGPVVVLPPGRVSLGWQDDDHHFPLLSLWSKGNFGDETFKVLQTCLGLQSHVKLSSACGCFLQRYSGHFGSFSGKILNSAQVDVLHSSCSVCCAEYCADKIRLAWWDFGDACCSVAEYSPQLSNTKMHKDPQGEFRIWGNWSRAAGGYNSLYFRRVWSCQFWPSWVG